MFELSLTAMVIVSIYIVSKLCDARIIYSGLVFCIIFCNFRDGATCSGLFITISNLIDQLHQEDELDICNAVRQIQIRRPQCIKDKVRFAYYTSVNT